MAAEAYELLGRQINDEESPSAETRWQVVGATSYANAYAALAAVIPTSFTFPSSRVAFLNGLFAEELLEDEVWNFRATYAAQEAPTFDDEEYSFDVSAPSDRIYQSLQTTAFNPAGKSTPNFGGAIGLADGQPQGAQPLTPFSTFAVTKHWPVAAVTQAYQLVIESLIGSVSSTTFNGRAAGTVRFLGCSGRRSGDKFPISYEFGFRPNVSAFTVDQITVTSANGWDIIDPFYEWQSDTTAKKPVRRPRTVFVHRIHPLANWAGLGL